MVKNYVNFNDAVVSSLENAQKSNLTELVSIENALGRVFSQNIIAKKNLPSFNNSAMDGFAIKAEDAGKTLIVKSTVYAGDVVEALLKDGECYKIMTGAQVPSDVDTVIPIENILNFENNEVTLPLDIVKGYAVRLKGEEVVCDSILFKEGDEVTAGTIAVLASQGIVYVEVYKKLSIAVVSTGNELKEPWESANDDEIYNCNSYGIIATLQSKGFDTSYIKVIPDNLDETVNFVSSLKNYDVIITSGGISMGDADFVGRAFEKNGLITLFDGINIKPGKPIMMGQMNNTFVVCLPGNPLTAMVNLYLFVLPALRKIQGYNAYCHNYEKALNIGNFKVRSGRVNIILGKLTQGTFTSTRGNRYGSGMITIVEESNAMLLLNSESNGCINSEEVKIISLDGRYIEERVDILT